MLAKLLGGAFVDRRAGRAGADLGSLVALAASGSPASSPVSAASRLRLVIVVIELGGAQPLFLGGMFGLFGQQRVAVGLGDLVIVGMDFAEGQEAVAIAAIIDERRLQRRFDPGHLGEIDITFELLVLRGFEIKFLDPISLGDGDPGLLRVARVD